MTTTSDTTGHPVLRGLAELEASLDLLASLPVWSLSTADAEAAVVKATRLAARTAELELRLARHAATVEAGSSVGATSTGTWWAVATAQTRPAAVGKLHLATALEDRWTRVGAGLAAGEVLVDQAEVIVRALDALPDDLDPSVVTAAESRLVADAQHHDARALKILGRRILDVVAPDIGDAHEARLLEAEEQRAAAQTRLTMTDDGHGTVHGRFTLPSLHAAMLKKALLALAAPKRHPLIGTAADGTALGVPVGVPLDVAERRPTAERMGRAFCEYVERYPTDRLPEAGGLAATVVVTMTLDQLTGTSSTGGTDRGAATLDTGDVISPGVARRMACEAGIIPAVLGGDSQVLDLGRKTRLHTTTQRTALALRDRGCTAEGCDWPPGLCHAHHHTPWHRGGGTSVANGRLLCPRHHARAHDPAYATEQRPGGRIAFTRRT